MIFKKSHLSIFILFFIVLCEWGVSSKSLARVMSPTNFQTVAPEKNGFSKKPLKTSISKIGEMAGVYGVIVIHNGYLSAEQYFREGTHDKPHNLKSASKSVLSALVGIAIDKGYLQLDQPISDFLPFVKRLADPRKNKITVGHLLSMESGLQSMSYRAYNSWVLNEDWLNKLLKLPIVAEPGTKHQYSTGDSHILSAVLTAATGMSTKEFAEKYLFDPMHIPIKGWEVDPQGIYQGGNNLSLYPTDMAKFGQLYLDGGQFKGEQIVPNWWVNESTKKLQPGAHKLYGGYGYLWYSQPGGENAFVAVGYGGQYIYVAPEYHAVIVVISTLKSKGKRWENALFNEIQHGILASINDGTTKRSSMGFNLKSTRGIATTTLNLRKGPGKKSLIIKTIEPGHILPIIKKKGAWLQVNASGEKGWVASRFINIVQPDNLAIMHSVPGIPQQSAVQSNYNPTGKLLEITLNRHSSALQELQRAQDKSTSFFKEYGQKQATLLANDASQKEALSPIKKQINNLMVSDAKTVATYRQLKIYLDQIRLGFDQIESRATTITDGLQYIQSKEKRLLQDQDDLRVSHNQLQQALANLSNKIDQQIEVLNDKSQAKHEEISSDLLQLQANQNVFKKELSNFRLAESHNAEEISKLSLRNKQFRKQKAAINNELAAIKGKLAKNTLSINETNNLQQEISQLHQELPNIKSQVKELIESDRQALGSSSQLNKRLDILRLAFDQLESRINTSTDISKKLDQQVALIEEKNRVQQQKTSKKISNLSLNIKRYRKQQAAINNEQATIKGKLANNTLAIKETSNLKQEIRQLHQELPNIKTQIKKLIESDHQVIGSSSQLNNRLDTLSLGFDQLESRINTSTDISKKLDQQVALIEEKNRVQQQKTANSLSTLQTSQNAFKKELATSRLTESHNTAEISNLSLSSKQNQKHQGAINNELATIKTKLANNTLASEDANNFKKELQQVKSDLLALSKRIQREQNSSANQLQTNIETTGRNQLSLTNNIAELHHKVEQERVGKEHLASEIDALKISLKSLLAANKHIREDVLAYEKKSKTMATKVLYLEGEVVRQQQIPKQLSVVQRTVEKISTSSEIAKLELISPFISSWSTAWSNQDVAMYFLHYSEGFKPSKGLSLKKWQAKRKRNIIKPRFIKITISNVQQEMLDLNSAKVVFNQSYESNSFSDHVLKTILLKWHKDSWKIIHEKSK